jgi:hypothetical protein
LKLQEKEEKELKSVSDKLKNKDKRSQIKKENLRREKLPTS